MKLSIEEREKRREKIRENKQRAAEMRRREFESRQMQPSLSDAERAHMLAEIAQHKKDTAFIERYFKSQQELNRALYAMRHPEHEQAMSTR